MSDSTAMASTGRSVPIIGALSAGRRNAITDVPGVTVGQHTLADGDLQTGVSVIRPHRGDPYRDRVPAAAFVLNGFGKSVGLMQLDELGVIETPIALTNTYAVAAMARAQIRQCIAANPAAGRGGPTVNPLVFECNDAYLNDLQRMALDESHYLRAYESAGARVEQGAVGAGRGMSCFGLKGGVGTASRVAALPQAGARMVGAFALCNFGKLEQLIVAGDALGARLARHMRGEAIDEPEKGSVIIVIATDAELDARQLRRLALRAGAGLARTGSVFGHGSGDIVLAFTTAYTLPQEPTRAMPSTAMLHDALLDRLFQAAADSAEQAIIHALWSARSVTGREGHTRRGITELPASWFQDSGAN